MTTLVKVTKLDNIYHRIDCEDGILKEIWDQFSFYAEGYRFHPLYKSRPRRWDGRLHLCNLNKRTLFSGLLDQLETFCVERDYTFLDDTERPEPLLDDTFKVFLDWLRFPQSLDGVPFKLRDYQEKTIKAALDARRGVFLSPTASGKTSILYALVRYLVAKKQKVLVLTPNVSLVHQAFGDFKTYSTDNGWDVDSKCYKIYAGIEKFDIPYPCVISTHQSITEIDKKQRAVWLSQFTAVLVDEVHLFAAKTTKEILESIDCEWRLGFTGTLNDTKTHEMYLAGIFGPIQSFVKTKELIEQGHLAELTINSIVLKHTQKPLVSLKSYQDEVGYLVSNQKRNAFLAKLALSCKGNTMVLFALVENHAEIFYQAIKKHETRFGKKVFLIVGSTPPEVREAYRQQIEKIDNAIIVGSYGVLSTGWNQRNLHNLIFAVSPKSKIRNLQTIGRGLRKGINKQRCVVYDLADDLTFGKSKLNYSLQHFMHRHDLYMKEQFQSHVRTIEV